LIAWVWEARAPPSSEIRAHNVVRAELHVDLHEDPPPSDSTEPVIIIEGPTHEPPERSLCLRMPGERCWGHLDHATEHLGPHVFRQVEDVLVSTEAWSGAGHGPSVA
jgi:hypothetical protein